MKTYKIHRPNADKYNAAYNAAAWKNLNEAAETLEAIRYKMQDSPGRYKNSLALLQDPKFRRELEYIQAQALTSYFANKTNATQWPIETPESIAPPDDITVLLALIRYMILPSAAAPQNIAEHSNNARRDEAFWNQWQQLYTHTGVLATLNAIDNGQENAANADLELRRYKQPFRNNY